MIKFNLGSLTNTDGETKDIIVQTNSPVPVKDLTIGVTAIAFGVLYLIRSAFKNGANAYCKAEYDTMKDLKIIK